LDKLLIFFAGKDVNVLRGNAQDSGRQNVSGAALLFADSQIGDTLASTFHSESFKLLCSPLFNLGVEFCKLGLLLSVVFERQSNFVAFGLLNSGKLLGERVAHLVVGVFAEDAHDCTVWLECLSLEQTGDCFTLQHCVSNLKDLFYMDL